MDNNKINFETERKKNSDIKIDYVENFKNLCGNTNIENPLHAWNFRQFFQPGGNQTPLLHDMHHHGIKCPISLEVKLNSSKEYEYLLHPGRSRHWAYHMLGQEDIPFPVIIHSRYKDNISVDEAMSDEKKSFLMLRIYGDSWKINLGKVFSGINKGKPTLIKKGLKEIKVLNKKIEEMIEELI